jgi:hypothetical protein
MVTLLRESLRTYVVIFQRVTRSKYAIPFGLCYLPAPGLLRFVNHRHNIPHNLPRIYRKLLNYREFVGWLTDSESVAARIIRESISRLRQRQACGNRSLTRYPPGKFLALSLSMPEVIRGKGKNVSRIILSLLT